MVTTAPPPRSPRADVPRTVASRFIILALCLAVVLSALAFGTVHSWSLALFAAGACFVTLAWLADAWRTRRLRLSRNPLQLPLLCFVIVGLVQLLPLRGAGELIAAGVAPVRTLTLDPFTTRLVIVQTLSLFVYFAAALSFIDSPRRLQLLARVVMIFGFLLAVFGTAQFFVSPEKIYGIHETKQSLAFGPFINRHHFAGYMELTLALPLGYIFAGAVERDKRILYGVLAAIMALALVLTNSRGGMLSLAAEMMFVVIVSAGVRRTGAQLDEGREESRVLRLRRVALHAGLGFALLVALFVGTLFFGGEGALSRLVGSINTDDPTTGRVQFWRATMAMIADHPLAGVGLGAFAVAYSGYDQTNGRLYRLEQAHNDYLQVVSDAGVAGAVLAVLFVALLMRAGFKRLGSHDKTRRAIALGALTGCFAVLVHSFFDFTLHTTSNALLFLMLAALATINGRVEQPSRRRRRRGTPSSGERGAASESETTARDAATVVAPETEATGAAG
jgi:O-antigen ligase